MFKRSRVGNRGGGITVSEFLVDKVLGFDSIWNALHTLIRIPAATFVAWGVLGDATPATPSAA